MREHISTKQSVATQAVATQVVTPAATQVCKQEMTHRRTQTRLTLRLQRAVLMRGTVVFSCIVSSLVVCALGAWRMLDAPRHSYSLNAASTQFAFASTQDSTRPRPISETLQPYLFPVQKVKVKRMEIAYVDQDSITATMPATAIPPSVQQAEPEERLSSTRGKKGKRGLSRSQSSPRSKSGLSFATDNRETLIFIHGLNGYSPIWNKQIQELRMKYRCVALDLPGFGRSSKSQQYTLSIFAYADALVQFMDALKIQKATLVGHSMGGQIALNVAVRYARRVSRVVLVSSTGLESFTTQEREAFHQNVTENTTRSKTEEQIRGDYNRFFFKTPADAEFLLKDRLAIRNSTDFDEYCYAVKQSMLAVVDMPTYDMLDGVNPNVLIIYGQNDGYIPNPFFHVGQRANEIGEHGKQRLRHSKLLMVPQCGHFAQFEKPDVVNKAIIDFIQSSF